MAKRFSLKNKLTLIFGLLITFAALIEIFFALRIARRAVTEKVAVHLTDKASDTAEIIDGIINSFFQFLEGVARTPRLRNESLSYTEKTEY